MGVITNFPAPDSGDLSWDIRALKNGAAQAAAAWEKVAEANGELTDMVQMWRQLADTADHFGQQLSDLAAKIERLGQTADRIEER